MTLFFLTFHIQSNTHWLRSSFLTGPLKPRTILVPRSRAPFGQHQESRSLARSKNGSPRFTDFPSLCACSESSLTNLIGSGLDLLCLQIHSKPECRWTWPEVAILGADQKERGFWGPRMTTNMHSHSFAHTCSFQQNGVNVMEIRKKTRYRTQDTGHRTQLETKDTGNKKQRKERRKEGRKRRRGEGRPKKEMRAKSSVLTTSFPVSVLSVPWNGRLLTLGTNLVFCTYYLLHNAVSTCHPYLSNAYNSHFARGSCSRLANLLH